MPQEIRLWKVVAGEALEPITASRLDLESRIEEWLSRDISVLGLDLLVIGRQVTTDFGGIIDLLCMDAAGDLVIVELKRDKTPRDITAQVIDYASWISGLEVDRLIEIADSYLGGQGALETAFRDAFEEDLPEILNESHQMVVVASQVDPASERIIKYLSDNYGVNINAVTFQHFSSSAGEEFLGRVFLVEPEEVDYKARTKGHSKRRPNLTYEELEKIAEEKGVGQLYRDLVDLCRPHFSGVHTTRSSICFTDIFRGGRGAILSLIPGESSEANGVCFQLYTRKLAEITGVELQVLEKALPSSSEEWRYYPAAPDYMWGHAGNFTSVDAAQPLLSAIAAAR